MCAATTGQHSFLWVSLLLTAQQGSLAQQDVTPCHPDPAAGCWPPETQQLSTKQGTSENPVTSLAQVSSRQTNTNTALGNTMSSGDKQPSSPFLHTSEFAFSWNQWKKHPTACVHSCTSQQSNSKCWSSNCSWTQQPYTSNKAPLGQMLWCQPKLSTTKHASAKPAVVLSFSEPWAVLCGIAAFHMEHLIQSRGCHSNCNSTTDFWGDKLYLEQERIALGAEKQAKQWAIKSWASDQRV